MDTYDNSQNRTAIRGIVDPRVERCRWFLEDPLALRVLLLCSFRTWLHKEPEKRFGLRYGEFTISRTETKLFRLKPTQQGKLDRTIKMLTRIGYISKTDRRIDNDGSTIYRYEANKIIFPLTLDRQRNRQRTDNEQALTTGTTETIKKDVLKISPPAVHGDLKLKQGVGRAFEEEAWAAAVEASNECNRRGRQ